MSRNNKNILLTFDDGPSIYTPQILDILKKEKVKVTFFFLGKNLEKHPEIASQAKKEGHTIANHSFSHNPLTSRLGLNFAGIEKTQKLLEKIDSKSKKLFRPPYGILINPILKKRLSEKGYKIVMFDTVGNDWEEKANYRKIANKVLSKAKNGSIIVLHDGFGSHNTGNRSQTVKALPIIIGRLKQQNYNFAFPTKS